jgi:hypothetical protein
MAGWSGPRANRLDQRSLARRAAPGWWAFRQDDSGAPALRRVEECGAGFQDQGRFGPAFDLTLPPIDGPDGRLDIVAGGRAGIDDDLGDAFGRLRIGAVDADQDHAARLAGATAVGYNVVMIIELVSFDRPEGFSDADLLEDAKGTISHWQADPDLIRKVFATRGDEVFGVYFWPDRAMAERAHDAAWVARFEARTGRVPRFSYLDVFMVIDNENGVVQGAG